MKLVFGSQEANELLARTTGKRFDLHDVDPLGYRPIAEPTEQDAHEPYCDVCGGYMEWESCWQCGGKGGRDGDDLMEEDPLWYDEDDWETCDICEGKGGYWICASLPHEEQVTP